MRYVTRNEKHKTVTWHDSDGIPMIRYYGITDATDNGHGTVTLQTVFLDSACDGMQIELPDTVLLKGVDI